MGAREDLLAIPDEFLRHGRIGHAALVHMDFLDAPKRWWTGYGDLEVGGFTWQGLGDLISISPIETSYEVSAQDVTFELAATPEMLALALAAKSRVRDRSVTISCELFAMEDVSVGPNDIQRGQPVASPFSMFSGTMQRMPWKAEGPNSRTIQLECHGLFLRRNAAALGLWNDSDQKARYFGDKGFERLPIYANDYETRWRG
ncbi:hypothetical protein [Paracoccus alkanivorans]|uniref:DUF2163 domain-containing protein n=1 Tax=Paracoccus alkanivorans TaxID=2116655 RepID=A0A3M0MIK0_9RHOB|nr:hypothetical protein [Paracoccus alkanivorans]RMC37491.1 hypothetical protein C9E81_01700 [Paracoccus alkanivorans]